MSNNKLFVHGFKASISIEERKQLIIELFSQYGNIKIDERTNEESINFVKDRDRGEGFYKSFCFVTMEDGESAQAVMENCNGHEFGRGLILSVSIAEERERPAKPAYNNNNSYSKNDSYNN